MHAIQVSQTGGPEVMRLAELPDPEPGDGELLVRVAAAGVNYIDCYHRNGTYPQPLPFVLGLEGVGRHAASRAIAAGSSESGSTWWARPASATARGMP